MPHKQLPLIAILGPTASGKTRRAVSLAKAIDAEIISADSRQVYRQMDLGTGKDLEDYAPLTDYFHAKGEDISGYHLIDICEPGYKYNLHEYIRDYHAADKLIASRGHNTLLCGGTGMYAEAILSGMQLPEVPENIALRQELAAYSLPELHEMLAAKKELHNTTDVDTKARAIRALEIQEYYVQHPEAARKADRSQATRPESLIILVDIPRDERRRLITERLDRRIKQGMTAEIEKLLSQGVKAEDLMYYGLEYKFVTQHVIGQLTLSEMHHALETAIHQFAKRQMTWFRGMERRGFTLHPLSYNLSDEAFNAAVMNLLDKHK